EDKGICIVVAGDLLPLVVALDTRFDLVGRDRGDRRAFRGGRSFFDAGEGFMRGGALDQLPQVGRGQINPPHDVLACLGIVRRVVLAPAEALPDVRGIRLGEWPAGLRPRDNGYATTGVALGGIEPSLLDAERDAGGAFSRERGAANMRVQDSLVEIG